MTFEELSWEYFDKFGEQPPIFSTLDENNDIYLKMLKEAIDSGERLTLEDIEAVFVVNKDAVY